MHNSMDITKLTIRIFSFIILFFVLNLVIAIILELLDIQSHELFLYVSLLSVEPAIQFRQHFLPINDASLGYHYYSEVGLYEVLALISLYLLVSVCAAGSYKYFKRMWVTNA